MRLQVTIPEHLWFPLITIAEQECRTPRQQLQMIMQDALTRVLQIPGQLPEVYAGQKNGSKQDGLRG